MPTVSPSVSEALITLCDVQRGILIQDESGATQYEFANPTIISSQVPFSIQSAKPEDIDMFEQRGVKISHKAYSSTNPQALIGDRIVDNRFTPPHYLIVQSVEDMGGMGMMWGVFCWMQQ